MSKKTWAYNAGHEGRSASRNREVGLNLNNGFARVRLVLDLIGDAKIVVMFISWHSPASGVISAHLAI
jgi:hypothetical protein